MLPRLTLAERLVYFAGSLEWSIREHSKGDVAVRQISMFRDLVRSFTSLEAAYAGLAALCLCIGWLENFKGLFIRICLLCRAHNLAVWNDAWATALGRMTH